MSLESLLSYCRDAIKAHPDQRREVEDIYLLAVSEIEDSESETEEVSKAVEDLRARGLIDIPAPSVWRR